MSTNTTSQINTANSEATEQLGEKIAKNLKGGEVIELVSDLGGGKTTFVRGLVRGLGSEANVSSPTFKLCNIYEIKSGKDDVFAPDRIYHYDFYRLADSGLMGEELKESLQDQQGVVVVEWGKIATSILPVDRVNIRFIKVGSTKRLIKIDVSPKFSYVLEGLQ